MILGADRPAVEAARGDVGAGVPRGGHLPEAMVNYLARLGWSHGDQEIFTRDELVRDFGLEQSARPARCSTTTKLEWLSQHWIKTLPAERIALDLAPFLAARGLPAPADRAQLCRIVETLRERARTLAEMAEQATFYLVRPTAYDPAATAKFWTPEAPDRYALLIRRLAAQDATDPESLELAYRGLAAELGVKLVELAQLTRIALTGKAASPPIFQVISILGTAEALARLEAAREAAKRAA